MVSVADDGTDMHLHTEDPMKVRTASLAFASWSIPLRWFHFERNGKAVPNFEPST